MRPMGLKRAGSPGWGLSVLPVSMGVVGATRRVAPTGVYRPCVGVQQTCTPLGKLL